MARRGRSLRNRNRPRVNRPPAFGGEDDGRPNVSPPDGRTEPKNPDDPSSKWTQNEDGTWSYNDKAEPARPDYGRWHRKTSDIKQKEDESDEDYKARQEKYRESRGRKSRKTLRSAYGKGWGKKVYKDTGTTAKERAKLRTKFSNVRGREDDLIRKIQGTTEKQEGLEEGDAKAEAIAKRLEALEAKKEKVTGKRKEAGSNLKEIRQARAGALEKAYENPTMAFKAKPGTRAKGDKSMSRSGNKKYDPYGNKTDLRWREGRAKGRGGVRIGQAISETGGRPLNLPGGRPNVTRPEPRPWGQGPVLPATTYHGPVPPGGKVPRRRRKSNR